MLKPEHVLFVAIVALSVGRKKVDPGY